ncbi:hypothetical protein QBC36DRAFT_391507 [Triangularia setosa]|uniref:Rhodopsin domain-containing protein n=1 Tax=Triangularia setosa TaxID=2587417 RepID=A0AAN6VYZ5_9PEZI|nr:hypothetical protein QBC36DRAFT_391507 [Podospora setosa]
MGLWDVEDWGVVADRACWVMTSLVVALRVYCRSCTKGGELGMDDYIALFCLTVFMATCILITLELRPFYLKTTVLFWGLAISSQACILATSVWWYKQCDPIEYGWDRSGEGTCALIKIMSDLGYFTSAYSAFLDVFFAFYPIPFIMRLNMPLRTRIAVATALGLSALAFVIFEILVADLTYPVPYLDILGVAEGCILMVCASLPTLGPLYRSTKTKITMYGDSRGTRQITSSSGNNHFESNHSQSAGASGFKGGRKFDSDAEGQQPSFDAIPLVSSDKTTRPFDGNDLEVGAIHRTMEVSVSSHSLDGAKSQQRAAGF